MNVRPLLTLLCALFLTSCGSVTVKQIAGDSVPEKVVADLCKGSWRGPDGAVAVFHMKDAARGIVEVRGRDADAAKTKSYLALRTLGERVVASVWETEPRKEESEPLFFLRMAVTPEHVSLFMPNKELFSEAVKKNRIAGKIEEQQMPRNAGSNEKPQKVESVVLEKFGLAEAEKLGGAVNCFDSDPSLVLVREAAPRPETKTEKSGGSKKPEPAPARTGAGKRR